ncbi:hypothetical protein QYE76_044649 [Lolium multiflorum]|uniref:Beta-glucosidase n=1 Tax=Lolium multiflorum TaxID=4521 RepID=A0AAD8TLG9_LOLMU|nr:hypothetical protein QYE76_044649 [Lolium multiflorum]
MAAGELVTMPGRAVLTFLLLAVASAAYDSVGLVPVSRRSFPKGFVFGTASSSYQEDVRLMKDMGMDAYRFSISWTRILPDGTLRGGVNKEGIQYYNNLINELLSKGLQPFVTLFHWDSPQALEDEYTGFLSHNIINDYKDYAEVCFREFGDRVKHWITFNEPLSFCVASYAMGVLAPGRCSPWEVGKCSAGDSGTEPYTVGHHQLLAHAAAFKLYKQKYQAIQKGKVGITLVTNWYVPFSHSKSDNAAAKRAIDFMLGWFMEPLKRGVYPQSMRKLVGNRLPQFTKEQSELVKGSFDFIGMNYYTANYAANLPPSDDLKKSYNTDAQANLTGVRNGVPIGPQAGTSPGTSWLYVYPQGFRDLLLYIKENYGNPTVYVTENGVGEPNNKSLTIQQALKDHARIDYHHKHLLALQSAIRDGANVKGYFAWSLLDDFEWVSGYTVRFGLHFVDYSDGQKRKRYPKQSARWFKKFLKR